MSVVRPYKFVLCCAAFGCASVPARADGIAGPVLGYVAEASGHSVRVIRGIPGAATLANSIDFGADVTAVWVSPEQDFALLLGAAGVRMASLTGDPNPVVTDPLLPAVFQPSIAAFSPTGQNALLYDTNRHEAWLVQVRNGSAAVATVDLSAATGTIQTLAVADGDAPLVCGITAEDATSVFAAGVAGGFRTISGFGSIVSVAFVSGKRDIVAADAGNATIWITRDPLSGAAPETLLALPPDAKTPALVGSSRDGARIAVLDGTSIVRLFELASATAKSVDAGVPVTALQPLHGNSVFRLTELANQPLWILDADGTDPAVYFIPALAVVAEVRQ